MKLSTVIHKVFCTNFINITTLCVEIASCSCSLWGDCDISYRSLVGLLLSSSFLLAYSIEYFREYSRRLIDQHWRCILYRLVDYFYFRHDFCPYSKTIIIRLMTHQTFVAQLCCATCCATKLRALQPYQMQLQQNAQQTWHQVIQTTMFN